MGNRITDPELIGEAMVDFCLDQKGEIGSILIWRFLEVESWSERRAVKQTPVRPITEAEVLEALFSIGEVGFEGRFRR